MERFKPYNANRIKGEIQYTSFLPDGKKETSPNWHDNRIQEIRSIFNRFKLKKRQPEIMKSILSGNDTFVILPTGSGKSLCFQAPSVFFPGITLVITPLTALIENQVENFNNNSYPVYHTRGRSYYENLRFKAIYPGMDGLSSRDMFSEIQNPGCSDSPEREIRYKLLYVSPERLCNPKFLRALREAEQNGLRIDHVVIDEVHCMSQWGFEFRESYLSIANFINQRPVRPIISAFTATATPKDITEIKNILHFPTDKKEYPKKKYRELFYVEERENLYLHVILCSDYNAPKNTGTANTQTYSPDTRQNTLISILKKNISKVCIIYRTTTSGVDELYNILAKNEMLKDRLVRYHAQMPTTEKNRNKYSFLRSYDDSMTDRIGSSHASGQCRNIMIATKAFGMGIDKKDISLIIHYDMPRSLEDYYQEAGRAGRDSEEVPMADCYLLYSVGPKKEKGTLYYTINWVTSEKESSAFGCMPVYSQFSAELRENIYFWSYYRLCYVKKYCDIVQNTPEAAHRFIIDYLKNEFTMSRITEDLDDFYNFADDDYPLPAAEKERFINECFFKGAAADRFINAGSEQTKQRSDKYRTEILRLAAEVNELHMNNTYAANLLRHHPDKYELNRPYILSRDDPDSGQEWISKKSREGKESDDVPGSRFHELVFTIHGDEKLSYFDMCVLDAVYSIEVSQKKTIYVQTIWEILTGRNPSCSSQEKLDFRADIQNSIDKMRAMSISLRDNQCGFKIKEEVFLPLTDKPKGQKGYSYSVIPPLFLYAEEMNGEIIKIPVSLLDAARVTKSACAFRPSTDNALLCHYLIHRIAISKNKRRGNYILFSTIKEILNIREDSCLFHKKVIAILDHYQNTGFFDSYCLYIKDYKFRFADGSELTENAYFQVTVTDTIKISLLNAIRSEGQSLAQEAERKLAAISPGRMDGIVLPHAFRASL